jgi:hypothetical protein
MGEGVLCLLVGDQWVHAEGTIQRQSAPRSALEATEATEAVLQIWSARPSRPIRHWYRPANDHGEAQYSITTVTKTILLEGREQSWMGPWTSPRLR